MLISVFSGSDSGDSGAYHQATATTMGAMGTPGAAFLPSLP
jgi:hypothetical protein